MNWTPEEVKLIVTDYFMMLDFELSNTKYNKSEHRRLLSSILNNRDKAIEYKHRNITAALMDMGLPFIKGYKPLFNYQQMIVNEISNYLSENRLQLEQKFDTFSEDSKIIKPLKEKLNFKNMISEAPKSAAFKEREPLFRPIKINYLKKEQNNRKLGEEGESLIFKYEKWRLTSEGKDSLADRVEWVSKDQGDGLGYDILSKNIDGTDRFIEVKTTKLSKETPIYLTKNEVRFANKNNRNFYLYRLFNFNDNPNFFIKNGEYTTFCNLRAETFRGYF